MTHSNAHACAAPTHCTHPTDRQLVTSIHDTQCSCIHKLCIAAITGLRCNTYPTMAYVAAAAQCATSRAVSPSTQTPKHCYLRMHTPKNIVHPEKTNSGLAWPFLAWPGLGRSCVWTRHATTFSGQPCARHHMCSDAALPKTHKG